MLWLRMAPRDPAAALPAAPTPRARFTTAGPGAAAPSRRAHPAATGATHRAGMAQGEFATAPAPPSEPAPAAPSAMAPSETAPPTMPGADEILRLAKRDVGKIDRELRQQFPDRAGPAPDSPRKRLEKIFTDAYAAAPPKWYEGARIVELTDPESNGTRIYRVQTALGAYCLFYPAKNGLRDQGSVTSGRPTLGTCP